MEIGGQRERARSVRGISARFIFSRCEHQEEILRLMKRTGNRFHDKFGTQLRAWCGVAGSRGGSTPSGRAVALYFRFQMGRG